nr:hypothetical protein [Tanacetum cinerariifolium]
MMATNDKESSAAGTDNRPPMLEESDFDSWKIRIERYIRGKPIGKIIWKSIENGPTPHPMITVTTGEGEQQTQVTREKTDEEFTEAENNKERADIQATNILSQGLPRHIFNTLNQTKMGKEIWENVELLMINDMKITNMEIPVHQRNSKFVNNLPSYWGKYVTVVKNSKDISTMSYVDLYTHLKSYEQHVMKTLSKVNQTSGNADPLAYMAQETQSSSYTPSQYVPPPPQTSTNPMTQATIQAGQITTKSVERKAPGNTGKQENKRAKDSQWFKDKALLMEAKDKGVVLDAEAEAFLADVECIALYAEPLAITTTTTFEVSHEDAYNSNVDEGPYAVAAFMTNLMQTGPSTREDINNDSTFLEVQTYDNHFFDNLNHQVSQEMHQAEQLDSNVNSTIDDDDNTIPYHQYQLNNEVKSVPTDVSFVLPGGISVITILDDLRVYDSEDTLLQAEVSRTKMLERMKDLLCKMSSKSYDQCVIDKKSFEIENKNLLIQNECLLAESGSKDICSIVLTFDIPVPMSVEPKNLELEAEILKVKQLLVEKEKRCLETKNTPLKEELTAVRIKNDSLRDENVSIKKRYQDLYKSKAESNSNVSNGAAIPEKPKVLAPGLYAMTPNVGSKWKPTGRNFTLGDTCPLTRITKHEVVPLEKSRNVSTSEPAINVTVTPMFSAKTLISYKRKDRKIKDTSTGSPPNAKTQAVNDPMNVNDLSV